jgi:hypothetical protein
MTKRKKVYNVINEIARGLTQCISEESPNQTDNDIKCIENDVDIPLPGRVYDLGMTNRVPDRTKTYCSG